MTQIPWHIGIYENGEQFCSGTLISKSLVISAAHCFPLDKNIYKNYKVVAGKSSRAFDKQETQEFQIRDVQDIEFPYELVL